MGYDPTDQFDFSLRSANVILREVMDAVHLPENCLLAYDVTREITKGQPIRLALLRISNWAETTILID